MTDFLNGTAVTNTGLAHLLGLMMPDKDYGSPIVLAALGIILAAFGIWLTVRLVNRRRKPSARFCICVVLVTASVGLTIWIPYYREQQAIKKIESWGGSAGIETVAPEWLLWLVGKDRLTEFKVFERVREVTLRNPAITAVQEVGHLNGLTKLKSLSLWGASVTDASLPYLRELTKLEFLSVAGTSVTDAGIVHLSGLKNLRDVDLSGTAVSDAGLIHLTTLPKLQHLFLDFNTAVTDAGLPHMSRLTNLDYLSLNRTSVTDKGIEDIQKELPVCTIIKRRTDISAGAR